MTPVTFNNQSGSYVIASSGEGYLTAVNPDFPNDQIVGLVSQGGVFIGSSTETSNLYNDLFIAAPVGIARHQCHAKWRLHCGVHGPYLPRRCALYDERQRERQHRQPST